MSQNFKQRISGQSSNVGGVKKTNKAQSTIDFDIRFSTRLSNMVTSKSVNTILLKKKLKEKKTDEFQFQFAEKVQESMVYWPRGWVSKNYEQKKYATKKSVLFTQEDSLSANLNLDLSQNFKSQDSVSVFRALKDNAKKDNLTIKTDTMDFESSFRATFMYQQKGFMSPETTQRISKAGLGIDNPKANISKKYDCMIGDMYARHRHQDPGIRLAVCVTMYNEGPEAFKKTMRGIIQNYYQLMDPIYGSPFTWDDIVIFLIVDGYEKIAEINTDDGEKESFAKYATDSEFFDIGYLQNYEYIDQHEDEESQTKFTMKSIAELQKQNLVPKSFSSEKEYVQNLIHLYQNTLRVDTLGIEDLPRDIQEQEINFCFAVKQINDKKINSHKWFFNGLCQLLNPQYTLLVDIGTEIEKNSLHRLINYMDGHPRCGGCCGELAVDLKFASYNLVELAQFYEYKVGHCPDKYFESFFGYTTVLPGAYSLFRFDAIIGQPIVEFYKGLDKQNKTCAQANRFLAEDRIMCFEVINRSDHNFYLTYVPEAVAYTDCPKTIQELMKQRRRWNNGSLFGAFHFMGNILRHISCRNYKNQTFVGFLFMIMQRFLHLIFAAYYSFNIILGLGGLGIFGGIITLMIKVQLEIRWSEFGGWLFCLLWMIFYPILIGFLIWWSVREEPKEKSNKINWGQVVGIILILASMALFYYLIIGYFIEYNAWDLTKYSWTDFSTFNQDLIALAILGLILYFVFPIILNPIKTVRKFDRYILGLIVYLLMIPALFNIMNIYSICNIDDVTWGTRVTKETIDIDELNEEEEKKLAIQKSYRLYKWRFVIMYLIYNFITAFVIIFPQLYYKVDTIDVVGVAISFWVVIKMFFATAWYVLYYLKNFPSYILLNCQKTAKLLIDYCGCCHFIQHFFQERQDIKREALKVEMVDKKMIEEPLAKKSEAIN